MHLLGTKLGFHFLEDGGGMEFLFYFAVIIIENNKIIRNTRLMDGKASTHPSLDHREKPQVQFGGQMNGKM